MSNSFQWVPKIELLLNKINLSSEILSVWPVYWSLDWIPFIYMELTNDIIISKKSIKIQYNSFKTWKIILESDAISRKLNLMLTPGFNICHIPCKLPEQCFLLAQINRYFVNFAILTSFNCVIVVDCIEKLWVVITDLVYFNNYLICIIYSYSGYWIYIQDR